MLWIQAPLGQFLTKFILFCVTLDLSDNLTEKCIVKNSIISGFYWLKKVQHKLNELMMLSSTILLPLWIDFFFVYDFDWESNTSPCWLLQVTSVSSCDICRTWLLLFTLRGLPCVQTQEKLQRPIKQHPDLLNSNALINQSPLYELLTGLQLTHSSECSSLNDFHRVLST